MRRRSLLLALPLLLPAFGAMAQAPAVTLSLGAGPADSAEHALALEVARRIADETGWTVRIETTGGGLPNAVLVHQGRIDLALVPLDIAYAALEGETAMAPGVALDGMRALVPLEASVVRFDPALPGTVAPPSLRGQIVSVGPGAAQLAQIVAAAGDAVRVTHTAPDKIAEAASKGEVTVLARFETPDALAVDPMGVVPDDAEVEAMLTALPWLAPIAVTKAASPDAPPTDGTATPEAAGRSVAVWTWLVARADLDRKIAETVTRIAIGTGAAPDPADNRVLPFHAGAAAAWKQAGITLPAAATAP
jgi:hypothetical protein